MIRKYHNHKPRTTPWHREEEPYCSNEWYRKKTCLGISYCSEIKCAAKLRVARVTKHTLVAGIAYTFQEVFRLSIADTYVHSCQGLKPTTAGLEGCRSYHHGCQAAV